MSFLQAENNTLCGMVVDFSSPRWGLEGEVFNVSLVIHNVSELTRLTLEPNWARLNISETELVVKQVRCGASNWSIC